MRSFFKGYFTTLLAMHLLTIMVPAISFAPGYKYFLSILLFFMLNNLVRPFVNAFLFPLNIMFMNIPAFLLFILTFYFWTFLSTDVIISSWQYPGIHAGIINSESTEIPSWQAVIYSAVFFGIIHRFIRNIFHE